MAQIEAGSHDLQTLVPGFFGKETPLGRQLSRRILDSWVHLQDMRMALGIDEGWDSAAARVVRGQLIEGTEYAWASLETGPLDAVRLVLTDIDETITLGTSPEVDVIGGLSMTVTNATRADDPTKLIYGTGRPRPNGNRFVYAV